MLTIPQFRAAVRQGPYAWPGGYPLYAIADDGGLLCWDCLKTQRRLILESLRDRTRDGWAVMAVEVLWEGPDECCSHCNAALPTAYGDPDAPEDAPEVASA